MQTQTFYSNGKLLLTGEYVVLDGAKALAVPTRFGQNLIVSSGSNQEIKWTSFDADKSVWFQDTITFQEVKNKILSENNNKVKNTLIEILHQAFVQNPTFLDANGYSVETELTFPRVWGLGTSSTLINNIGQGLEIDAFELLQKSFGGSGYDIACAQNCSAIIYQLENDIPNITPVHFDPEFKENIHFVYLNKKQSSKSAISNYLAHQSKAEKVIPKISNITYDAIECKEGKDFAVLMERHEIIMSDILEAQTVKELHFDDFSGVVKSLGAWGSDFAMVISRHNPKDYFVSKGFGTVLTYEEMVL